MSTKKYVVQHKNKKRKKEQEKMNTRIHLIYIYAREARKKRKERSKALSGQEENLLTGRGVKKKGGGGGRKEKERVKFLNIIRFSSTIYKKYRYLCGYYYIV